MITFRRWRNGINGGCGTDMTPSQWFAEYGSEGHVKNLIAVLVADMQDPTAPVFLARRHDERSHHKRGLLTRLSQVPYGGAASIHQHAFGVGVLEIDLSHVPRPLEKANRRL